MPIKHWEISETGLKQLQAQHYIKQLPDIRVDRSVDSFNAPLQGKVVHLAGRGSTYTVGEYEVYFDWEIRGRYWWETLHFLPGSIVVCITSDMVEAMVSCSDDTLYEAKNRGRNKVVIKDLSSAIQD